MKNARARRRKEADEHAHTYIKMKMKRWNGVMRQRQQFEWLGTCFRRAAKPDECRAQQATLCAWKPTAGQQPMKCKRKIGAPQRAIYNKRKGTARLSNFYLSGKLLGDGDDQSLGLFTK